MLRRTTISYSRITDRTGMAKSLDAYLANRSRNGVVLAGSAAAVAAMALWNTYRARKVEQEHPPRGRYISVEGVRLHYLERGEGRPVLLLHGNIVTADDFAGVATPACAARSARRWRSSSLTGPFQDGVVSSRRSDHPHGFWSASVVIRVRRGRQRAALTTRAPPDTGGRRGRQRAGAVQLARNATLAESSIDILLWSFPLKSHFAAAAEADPQVVRFQLHQDHAPPALRADVPLFSIPAIPVIGDLIRYVMPPSLTCRWR
jgi:hypothetical protein